MRTRNLLLAGVAVVLFGIIVGAGFALYARDTEPPTLANVYPVPLDAADIVPARGTFNPQHLTEKQRKLVLMGFVDGVWSMSSACDKLGITDTTEVGSVIIAAALRLQEFDFTPEDLRVAALELNALHIARTAY